ncbi:MAG: hypothetical protein PHY48_13125 [Candidatus Cloacimonetes bacterium]|jgi:hypothetical protein|nr:hypothetical protein [Candidatus Cloacimonadota bacterium]
MNRVVFAVIICFAMGVLNAQTQDNDTNQLSSIIIRVNGSEVGNFKLQNAETNIGIRINDLSRQLVRPGAYTLSYEQWGFHKHKSSFDIGMNEEKRIEFQPVPINPKVLKKYNNSSKLSTISLITSAAALGCAGLCKVMGDSEYDKYSNSTDADEITDYRSSSEIYQIAFLSSSSLFLGSAATWVLARFNKKAAKTRIIYEMNQQEP